MKNDTQILLFRQSETIADPLTELAREGAGRMLAEALKAEADAFVASFADEQLEDGRQQIVRHGFGPERQIQTGIGSLDVQRPKVRDLLAASDPSKKIRFTSNILPKMGAPLGELGCLTAGAVSEGHFDGREALSAIMGPDAPNLSPGVISRLTAGWQAQYDTWSRRDLSARRCVYIWADGVYLQARMEENAECMLVVIGATLEGKKELIGFQVGLRESAQSWHELLTDIKSRGLSVPPEIAVGDGAMGFWNALNRTFPGTKHQRCWVHKVKNVLNCFPKQMAPAVKSDLDNIQHAGTRKEAEAALAVFCKKYEVKYPKGVTCLIKDQDAMLAFFDFPAEHWIHLRISNPIESVFATVRHRTVRTKGALSQKTAKLMVFTLIQAASKKWLRLKGRNQLPKVIKGIKSNDGLKVTGDTGSHAA